MAVAYRNVSTATGTSTSASGTLPATSVNGDWLLAAVSNLASTPAAITVVPDGWTLLQTDVTSGTGDDSRLSVYSRENNSEAGPWTWTLGAGDIWAVHIVAVSGATALVSAKDKNDTAGATLTAPSVDASGPGVLVCFYGRANKNATCTTSALTERGDDDGLYTATGTVAAAGATGTKDATANNSTRVVTISVAAVLPLNNNGLFLGSL